MDGIATPPRLVECQRERADRSTSPIIRQAMAEERTVTAIMLDHEAMYEKPCNGHRNNKSEPVAEAEGDPHYDPQRDKGPGCDCKFKGAASMVRLAVAERTCAHSRAVSLSNRFPGFIKNSLPRRASIAVRLEMCAPRDGFLAPSGAVYASPPRLHVPW